MPRSKGFSSTKKQKTNAKANDENKKTNLEVNENEMEQICSTNCDEPSTQKGTDARQKNADEIGNTIDENVQVNLNKNQPANCDDQTTQRGTDAIQKNAEQIRNTIDENVVQVNANENQPTNCDDQSSQKGIEVIVDSTSPPKTPIDAIAPPLPSANKRSSTGEGRRIFAEQFVFHKVTQKVHDMQINCETPTSHCIREKHFVFSGGGLNQPAEESMDTEEQYTSNIQISPSTQKGEDAAADLSNIVLESDEEPEHMESDEQCSSNMLTTPSSQKGKDAILNQSNFALESDEEIFPEFYPVEFDQNELEPQTISFKKPKGRPSKKKGGYRVGSGRKSVMSNGSSARPLTPISSTPLRRSSRQIQLSGEHIKKMREQMEKLQKEYNDRPWPSELKNITKRKSTSKEWTRCSENCDCTSYAKCQQNAIAWLAAKKYQDANTKLFERLKDEATNANHHEQILKDLKAQTGRCHTFKEDSTQKGEDFIGCAAFSANHRVQYYDSGTFGDEQCNYCEADLLKGQKRQYEKGKSTACCLNGECHTKETIKRYEELQNPPEEYKELAENEEFLENTKPLNNTYAYASIHCERAPDDQLGSRLDTCKVNGEWSFQFYDLKAPVKDGKMQPPAFAQVYTLLPEDAMKLRTSNFEKALGKPISKQIMKTLEKIMRESPFGKTFVTTGDIMREAEEAQKEIPRFQIVLLTTREMKGDAIRNKQNVKIVERTDMPTAEQVAVIWVDEEGLAPKVQGFPIFDHAGKKRILKSGMPQLFPACFPLLSPKSTPGWKWFMKKAKFENDDNSSQKGNDIVADVEDIQANFDITIQQADEQGEIEENVQDLDVDEENSNDDQAATTKTERKNISERNFWKYMLAVRGHGKNKFHWLWFARRLAEYFVISILNSIERNEMEHVKEQQKKKNLRKILARDYIKAIEKGLDKKHGGKLGQVFLMPQKFLGSTRYYQSKYADLMTMVRNLGNPTWFVTFTGNPMWPEIQSALQKGQDWVHRADIVCDIFMDKAKEFIRDVTEKNVLGPVAGWCYSVEHQKRGMPHIHLLLILKEGHKITTPEKVNDYVLARLPPLPPMDDMSPEAHQQRRLWYYVTNCMLHYCNNSCGGNTGQCKKHFPKGFSKQTILSAERYAQYRRLDNEEDAENIDKSPQKGADDDDIGPHNDPGHHIQVNYQRKQGNVDENIEWKNNGLCYFKRSKGKVALLDDRNVIPYNPYLLLKYGCHINIEYVFGQKACKYLFKYILKGFEKAYVKVVQPGTELDEYDYDEIYAFFKCRYMTAMEAFLRLFSFKIVEMSHQIYTLSVHDEYGQSIIMEEGEEEANESKLKSDTRLTAFFKLATMDDFAKKLRYDEVPLHYWWNNKDRTWIRRKNKSKSKFFVRIYTVSANRPELMAIRTLLMHVPGPTSFADLRTVDGVTYATFCEAAKKRGLFVDDQLFYAAMEDACGELTGIRLLRYFAMLIYHGHPMDPKQMLEDFLDKLNPAPPVNAGENENVQPLSRDVRRNKVLRTLEYFFRCQRSTCSDMGVGEVPADYNHEEQEDLIEGGQLAEDFYGTANRSRTPKDIATEQIGKLNDDQKSIFETVKEAIFDEDKERLFFIEGGGGCGKTFLYNTIIKWCLACLPNKSTSTQKGQDAHQLHKGSVISAASTGIAATLLIGASTVHRQFYVPNNVNDKTTPKINHESESAQRFRDAHLIIIDEISMLNRKVLNYLDRFLQEICQTNKAFGGKLIILGGDWKQLAPVVVNGGKTEQIEASIKMDPLFKQFQTLRLTKNMRTDPDQISLCEWLKQIGNGRFEQVEIPGENQSTSLDDIIDYCFPPQLFEDPLNHWGTICDAALLCPRNEDVFKINDNSIKRMKGKLVTSVSIDQPLKCEEGGPNQFNSFRADANLESIHKETPTGLPPHILHLKVGAPVMLIRNLDLGQGLCNGTRLQITRIGEHNLKCRILTGPRANKEVLIPKIRFDYGTEEDHRGARFERVQYPIRLCFAMTVNKSQGQTLKRMGLVLKDHQCFSHGQVYVAMSRVTQSNGIRVLSPTIDGFMQIENIVYQELLDEPMPIKTKKALTNVQVMATDSDEESIFSDYFTE